MAKVKVAQCWDDGPSTDVRLVSILRKYGAKATFNLNPGYIPEKTDAPSWAPVNVTHWTHLGFRSGKVGRDLLKPLYKGFQLASHCLRHETLGNPDVSMEAFVNSAVAARKFLEETFEQECPGFAWPCGQVNDEACRLLREQGFIYGRTTVKTHDVTICNDTMALASSCHFQDWEFLKRYEEAKKNSGVFYFWGHSYETLNYEMLWAQLEQKIRFISEDPDAEWVDVKDLVPLCHPS